MSPPWEKHYRDRIGCSIIYIVILLIALAIGWTILARRHAECVKN